MPDKVLEVLKNNDDFAETIFLKELLQTLTDIWIVHYCVANQSEKSDNWRNQPHCILTFIWNLSKCTEVHAGRRQTFACRCITYKVSQQLTSDWSNLSLYCHEKITINYAKLFYFSHSSEIGRIAHLETNSTDSSEKTVTWTTISKWNFARKQP